MKSTSITLSRAVPRDEEEIRSVIPLRKGLTVSYAFAVFFMIASLVPLIAYHLIDEGPFDTLMTIYCFAFLIVADLIGVFIFVRTHVKYTRRLNALVKGIPVAGTVEKQERKFVFWKSNKDYVLVVKFNIDDKNSIHSKVCSGDTNFHLNNPEGKQLTGFYDAETKAAFFPVEIGMEILIS
jgi:hypothetical protein